MVREATESDLDSLLELYLFLHDERIPEHDDHLIDTWNRMLAAEDHHVIVNEVEGEVVASCVCVIIPNISRNVRPFALVEYVVTHGNHRKRGYANQCLAYAKELAEAENCYKIMLITGSADPEVHEFYKNAGYSSEGKTAFVRLL